MQEAIRVQRQRTLDGNPERAYAPLKDFVRFSQVEFFGGNNLKLDAFANYAQGWSFVYFLRQGAASSKSWNPAWSSILDTYRTTLIETVDPDKALERAFSGVDWDELEKAWADFTLM
jgi:hypothetical protein